MAGKDRLVSDCLLRTQVGAVHLEMDSAALVEDQDADLELKAFWSATIGLRQEDVTFQDSGVALLCDTSMGLPGPLSRQLRL